MYILRLGLPVQKLQLSSFGLNCIKSNQTTGLFYRWKTSYIVLLPEVPEDTADSNPLLSNSEFPNFSELTAEKCYTGVGKHCLHYETGVWGIEEKIKDRTTSRTFSTVIDELDRLDAPLAYAWSTVKTLYSVKNDKIPTSTYLKIHERARKARANKFQSKPIYEACKEIYVKETSLNEAQKRIVRKYLLEARLNGVELLKKDAEVLTQTLKKLEDSKVIYKKKLAEASSRFSYRIIDHEIVRDFPTELLKRMSFNKEDYLKGPWTVTHHPLVYHKFLEYCPDKDLRWNAWQSYIMRCSVFFNQELNNAGHVGDIRDHRFDQANLLGFKNFAEMSMETKMAGSVDNVLTMITSLYAKAKDQQEREVESLKEFANSRGFRGDLEECDVPYWRRKQLAHITQADDLEMNKYFPFDHVWSQLLSFCSSLFGIHFEEVAPNYVNTWHQDVRFYNVLDSDGRRISSFYLDSFKRSNEKLYTHANSAWMLTLKTRCDVAKNSPLASLVFNFEPPRPENGNTALLTFEDVQTLFKKFGHGLQHLLSTVSYGEASGLTNIEWDAVETCPQFLLNWLYEPTILEKISRHHESGNSLDKRGIESILTSRTHMAAYDLCYELFLSHLDIRLHTEKTYWGDVMSELWSTYMPFELHKRNVLPCWFSPIMSDVWAAAHYSHTWSKMLAADAYGAFKESEPHEVTAIGKRFRDTFLSLGGGLHPAQVFREFRGRDPMPEALATVLNIS